MRSYGAKVTILAALLAACASGVPAPLGDEVTVATAGASNPTVAVDRDAGAFYVAWVGTEGGESNVYFARSSDAAAFEPPVRANGITGDAAPHEQAHAQVAVGRGRRAGRAGDSRAAPRTAAAPSRRAWSSRLTHVRAAARPSPPVTTASYSSRGPTPAMAISGTSWSRGPTMAAYPSARLCSCTRRLQDGAIRFRGSKEGS